MQLHAGLTRVRLYPSKSVCMMPIFAVSSGPQSSRESTRRSWSNPFEMRLLRRRRVLFIVVALFATLMYATHAGIQYAKERPEIRNTEYMQMLIGQRPSPPLYHNFRKAERRLPQHIITPFAKGEKYLWVASHSCCM